MGKLLTSKKRFCLLIPKFNPGIDVIVLTPQVILLMDQNVIELVLGFNLKCVVEAPNSFL